MSVETAPASERSFHEPADASAPSPSDPIGTVARALLVAFLHPVTGLLGTAGLVAGAFIIPPEGLGGSTCAMIQVAGIPCPSCGLTRSVSSVLHGEFLAAWQYNPFGYGFVLAFLLVAPSVWLGRRGRDWVQQRLEPAAVPIAALIIFFVLAMMAHGIWRGAAVLSGDTDLQWWRTDEPAPALRSDRP